VNQENLISGTIAAQWMEWKKENLGRGALENKTPPMLGPRETDVKERTFPLEKGKGEPMSRALMGGGVWGEAGGFEDHLREKEAPEEDYSFRNRRGRRSRGECLIEVGPSSFFLQTMEERDEGSLEHPSLVCYMKGRKEGLRCI